MDSRLFVCLCGHDNWMGFWGIVWTAGLAVSQRTSPAWYGFWGIVWTAGPPDAVMSIAADNSFWGIVWTAG